MELEGGIRVTIGELRKDQPFRVCIHGVGDAHSEFWTNHPEDAAMVFTMCAARLIVTEGAKRQRNRQQARSNFFSKSCAL